MMGILGKAIRMLAILLLLTAGMALNAAAAPKAELWPRWQGHDPQSQVRLDHSAWARFLEEYLVLGQSEAVNLLRYGAVTPADKQSLDDYLTALAAIPVTKLNRAEQKAYWINLYNALTVKTVLDHFPIKSIREIKSGWLSPGPWDLKLTRVEGVELSLNDIEHRILRPIWQDNRVHYAVNCASLGCPSLQPDPFTSENSEQLLERGARQYVNHPRGVRLEQRRLVLSSIYDWFASDFGGSEAALRAHLETFAAPELAARLRSYRGSITYQYDWDLNQP